MMVHTPVTQATPKEWFWLDYVDWRGTHRIEVDSLKTGKEVIAGIKSDGWRIVAQPNSEIIIDNGYQVALDEWLLQEADFQRWLAELAHYRRMEQQS